MDDHALLVHTKLKLYRIKYMYYYGSNNRDYLMYELVLANNNVTKIGHTCRQILDIRKYERYK